GTVADQADPGTGGQSWSAAVLAVPRHAVFPWPQSVVCDGAVPHVRIARDDRRLRVEPVPEADGKHVGGVVDPAGPRITGRVGSVRPGAHHVVVWSQLLAKRTRNSRRAAAR